MRVIPAARQEPAFARPFAFSRRWPELAIAGVAFAAMACSPSPSAPPAAAAQVAQADGFQESESPSLEFLPRRDELPGWALDGDPLVVPAASLSRYLGRQGNHYLAYDITDLTVGKYVAADGQGSAVVEIYRFPDFIKPFGAHTSREEAVTGFLEIPNQSFITRHAIHIWRGSFYIRLVGGGGVGTGESLRQLAIAVAERIPEAPGRPAVYQFLPEEGRVPNSEAYSAKSVFGQPYLSGGFTAQYVIDGQPIEGVVLPAPNKDIAREVLDRYKTFFVNNGRLLDPIPNLGEDNFTGEDRYLGRTVAFRLDRFVVAFKGFGEMQKLIDLTIATDQRILNSIRSQLQAADRAALEQARRTAGSGGAGLREGGSPPQASPAQTSPATSDPPTSPATDPSTSTPAPPTTTFSPEPSPPPAETTTTPDPNPQG